jgi:hypothetical protein
MTAIRDILKVNKHQIHYTLPDDFNYNEVEIIILPKEEREKNDDIDIKSFSNHSASTIDEWMDDSEDDIWK